MGFLTRGCNRSCDWCIVPNKEGRIKKHADIEEFTRHRDVVLLDNNVLAHPWGIEQIEKIGRMGLRIDFNQGLDARMIDDTMARILSKVSWRKPLRLACDHVNHIEPVRKAVELLRWHNVTPARYFVYVLVQDIDTAIERIRFLKGMYLDPFAQPFMDFRDGSTSKEQREFARWVNRKHVFKGTTWEDYKKLGFQDDTANAPPKRSLFS